MKKNDKKIFQKKKRERNEHGQWSVMSKLRAKYRRYKLKRTVTTRVAVSRAPRQRPPPSASVATGRRSVGVTRIAIQIVFLFLFNWLINGFPISVVQSLLSLGDEIWLVGCCSWFQHLIWERERELIKINWRWFKLPQDEDGLLLVFAAGWRRFHRCPVLQQQLQQQQLQQQLRPGSILKHQSSFS